MRPTQVAVTRSHVQQANTHTSCRADWQERRLQELRNAIQLEAFASARAMRRARGGSELDLLEPPKWRDTRKRRPWNRIKDPLARRLKQLEEFEREGRERRAAKGGGRGGRGRGGKGGGRAGWLRKAARRMGKGPRFQVEDSAAGGGTGVKLSTAPENRLLVFGVVTNPRTPAVRRWIRRT